MRQIEVIREILSCVQLFVTGATAVGLLWTFAKFTQKPADSLKERLKEIEKRLNGMDAWKTEVESRLTADDNHFKALDDSNKITQRALLAIMDNALGNDADAAELKAERNRLYNHLFDAED